MKTSKLQGKRVVSVNEWLAVVILVVLAVAVVQAKEAVTYERYLLQGDLSNSGSADGPPTAGENLSFVTLEKGRVVAENSPLRGETLEALPDMRSQIPGGLTSIRVAAWVRTREDGSIRRLEGSGLFNEKDSPAGIHLQVSGGRLAWSATGCNGHTHSLRGTKRVNDGRWHHVAVVDQPCGWPWQVIALYVDGELDASYNWYDCRMVPDKVQVDSAFGFYGQMSRLEVQDLTGGPQYYTGSGETALAVSTDPLYEASTIPMVEPPGTISGRPTSEGVVCVEDYGTAGNGRADDTAALLEAVSALDPAQGKDTLYFPPGTYKLTQSLRLPSGVDVVGVGALITRDDGPAVELVGEAEGISFRGLNVYGGPKAAVYQHGGTARNIYFEACTFTSPYDGKPAPAEANDYRGRTSDGLLFTDIADSTILQCNSAYTAGRAGIAVEGKMENLSVLRCILGGARLLTGFYFDAPDSGPALLLDNSVHCNMGYAIVARGVQGLVVRGFTTEGMGCYLPKEAANGPMYDIRNGTRVVLEMFSVAGLQLAREGTTRDTWIGSQLRINGRDNTLAGCYLIVCGPMEDPSLDSDDPRLVLWGTNFRPAELALSGPAERRAIIGSRFADGEYAGLILKGNGTENLVTGQPPISPAQRIEPRLWGPPEPRFTWGELGLSNVRDFGATGDGETDDSPAFNRALSRGGILYVPAGTYLLGQPVVSRPSDGSGHRPGFTLLGEGIDRTILVAKAGSPGIIRAPLLDGISGCEIADMTLRGGDFGVYVEGNTSGWFVRRVRFEGQKIAGFAADSFDNGNMLMDCTFVGGKYGFVGGGWNRHFLDKTCLWRCAFDGQSETGVMLASVDNAPTGARTWMHTMLRDCTIRNTGGPGVVIASCSARPVFLDHCLIENCGQTAGAPYVRFDGGGGSCAAMYHTTVRHTEGPLPEALVSITNYSAARLMDVELAGAEGAVALRTEAPYTWLERVSADGSLEVPAELRIVTTGDLPPLREETAGQTGLVLVEHSRFVSMRGQGTRE